MRPTVDASRDKRQGDESEVEQKLLHADYPFSVTRGAAHPGQQEPVIALMPDRPG